VSKPPTDGSFALPDATNDPTAEGALLQMFDDSPLNSVGIDYLLPAARWEALGNPAGSKGFRYRGDGSPGDPCRVVVVKPNVVKAACKGSDVHLPTPFLGQIGVVLTVGSGSKRYCALFGGQIAQADADVLKRVDAPAPAFCPLNLVSSTTSVVTSTSTTTSDTVTPTTSTTTSTVCTDADGDGYCAETDDCDDGNRAVNPGATEICNGIDDDCNARIDDGVPHPTGALTMTMAKSLGNTTVSWNAVPNAIQYDILSGDLQELRAAGGHYTNLTQAHCFANDTAGTSMSTGANPTAGKGQFWLMRAVGCTGLGPYNEGVPSQVGSRDQEIGSSLYACP